MNKPEQCPQAIFDLFLAHQERVLVHISEGDPGSASNSLKGIFSHMEGDGDLICKSSVQPPQQGSTPGRVCSSTERMAVSTFEMDLSRQCPISW